WDFSPTARIVAMAAALAAGMAAFRKTRSRTTESARQRQIAMRLDDCLHAGGEVLTGYELSTSSLVASPVELTRGLAVLAVERARLVATTVTQSQAVSDKPLRIAAGCLVAIVAIGGIVGLAAPRMARTECARFFDPLGDHPPFSATQLQLEPGSISVRYGDGFEVRVTTTGPELEGLDLILEPSNEPKRASLNTPPEHVAESAGAQTSADAKRSGTASTSGIQREPIVLPMFRQTAGEWRAVVASVTSDLAYYAQARSTRTPRYQIRALTVPEITEVRFRVLPVDYTREPIYEGPMPSHGITGLADTVIEVVVTSNRPLKSGRVKWSPSDHSKTGSQPGADQTATASPKTALAPLTLEPVGGTNANQVTGRWLLDHSGSFAIHVTDQEGQESREPFRGMMELRFDQKPFARFLEPAALSYATPSVELPVTIAAEDDFGVSQLRLFRSINGRELDPIDVPLDSPPARRQEVSLPMQLGEWGVAPGDVVTLLARVSDNHPGEQQVSDSEQVTIQIVSDDEFSRLLRSREGLQAMIAKYEQAQRQLEHLVESLDQLQRQLEKRSPEGKLTEAERERVEEVEKQAADAAASTRESTSQDFPYDLDQSLKQELDKMADKLGEFQQQIDQSREEVDKAGDITSRLAEWKQQLDRNRRDFQHGVTDPLEQLSRAYPLLEDQRRFAQLQQRQQSLTDRMKSLKNEDSGRDAGDPQMKADMRQLEQDQQQLREDLGEWLSEIDNHALQLPSEPATFKELGEAAREFANQVRNSEIDRSMSAAEKALAEFRGEQGQVESQRASDAMRDLMQAAESMGQSAEQTSRELQFTPGEGALGDTLEQLLEDAGLGGSSQQESSPEQDGKGSQEPRSGGKPGASDSPTESEGSEGNDSEPQGDKPSGKNDAGENGAGKKRGGKNREGTEQPGESGESGSSSRGGQAAGQRSDSKNRPRRKDLEKVGLYGHLPATRNPRATSGGNRQSPTIAEGTLGTVPSADRSRRYDPHGMLRASGLGESAVPMGYRQRVQQYFQRIAEEARGDR
ncbi:MAG: Chromosome partition protein Smc, partial [Planctomycetota bacterium]